ncbi:hypothetical protein K402DRAFT_416395 [Aulographum hederae CBS 113979]|uniref:tRNA (adenine(58)-N(1))-methyltransferase catalytic subunit TRM61 n=1 Tax=Aulographum hederae CBS 113979 TaxID=1176131 RepID=A0A6G1HF72_9PEZI|nr:hypothetical protein K402DRAFT_416395 [Aulographum hederae CBS 113979]
MFVRGLRTSVRDISAIHVCRSCRRAISSASDVFREGDRVLLRKNGDPKDEGTLLKPLSKTGVFESHRGKLPHSEIIGKRVRETVKSNRGSEYRLHEPTLAEYVRLTPRIVTPIYPGDANLIVSLLDIHAPPPDDDEDGLPVVEILEAGTGHGALTLHLARAIHAANIPYTTPRATRSPSLLSRLQYLFFSSRNASASSPHSRKPTDSRRAILHTLDISAKHSAHAQKVVQGFRHGLYSPHVDFHVGNVSDFITSRLHSRPTASPFLTHAMLDLPGTHEHLATVASALRVDAPLAVFNPSITQIAECVTTIRRLRLPLQMEQVVELGQGISAGRKWDVRSVRPRAVEKMIDKEAGGDENEIIEDEKRSAGIEVGESQRRDDDGWQMVCRPLVGDRVVGGGFLGLWRKARTRD